MHLLDANAFMEASRLYYSFRIAPGYWDWLVEKFEAGEIASVEAVYDEITAGSGDLVTWAKDSALDGFWLPDTSQSIAATADLASWATNPDRPFKQAAVDEFMASADLRLCRAGECTWRDSGDPRNVRPRLQEARQVARRGQGGRRELHPAVCRV